jgi:hypothetical protein
MRRPTSSDRLTSIATAARLGVSHGTLRNWRSAGAGPVWHTLKKKMRRRGKGSRPRVYYVAAEVDAFIKGGFDGKGQAVRSKA